MAQSSKRRRDDRLIKGDPINPPAAVTAKYRAELSAMIEEMSAEIIEEIKAWMAHPDVKEYFAQDDSPSSQARILTNSLIKKFTERFARKAKTTAERFTSRSNKANESAVKSSIRKMADSLSIPATPMSPAIQEILSATITENVSLIKSIGQQYLGQVQQTVMRRIAMGTDITGLVKDLQKHKGISLRRAQIIAFDQTHKISNSLSRARFQKAGLVHYIWRHTSGSNEPRPLHVHYDGMKFRYDTPVLVQKAKGKQPEVWGYPGTLISCSCRQQPVVEFSDEE